MEGAPPRASAVPTYRQARFAHRLLAVPESENSRIIDSDTPLANRLLEAAGITREQMTRIERTTAKRRKRLKAAVLVEKREGAKESGEKGWKEDNRTIWADGLRLDTGPPAVR